jgi:uncharacterized membrane protein
MHELKLRAQIGADNNIYGGYYNWTTTIDSISMQLQSTLITSELMVVFGFLLILIVEQTVIACTGQRGSQMKLDDSISMSLKFT